MSTLLLCPALDNRYGQGRITSRLGIEEEATTFAQDEDLYQLVAGYHNNRAIHCVMIDEAQFLKKNQVYQLGRICDEIDIPVLAYGLRTDFQGEPFEGSQYLLSWADNLRELKAICHCGSKATMVLRTDAAGHALTSGTQIEIGGNDRYVSVCRKHFHQGYTKNASG